MAVRLAVVMATQGNLARLGCDAGSRVVVNDYDPPFEAGALVFVTESEGELSPCPLDKADRNLGRVALIKDGSVVVTRGTFQHEAFVKHGLTVQVGDTVLLRNGFFIEAVANEAEDVLKGMGVGKSDFSLKGIKFKPEELASSKTEFAGYAAAKLEAQDFISRALAQSEIYSGTTIRPPRGLVILGPPGTGKTTLARHLAIEAKATLYILRGPEVLSKWVGDSERNLKAIFDNARSNPPSIIFIDEIDALAMTRQESHQEHSKQLVATLLSLMDGFTHLSRTAILGTTNRIGDLDPAFRRAGRLDHEILLENPTESDRKEILQVMLGTRAPPGVLLAELARMTEGWSGSDLTALCRGALELAARDDRLFLWQSDFLSAYDTAQERRQRRSTRA